jgi:hypothetical protein
MTAQPMVSGIQYIHLCRTGLNHDMRNSHSWARNLKNVAPQKQNSIFKTRTQYAIRNCAFKLFKAHCTATIKTKNASY